MSIRRINRHQKITIMGLGLFGGGTGAARFWHDLGAEVTVTDLRDAQTLQPSLDALAECNLTYILGQHRKKDFTEADLVVVNPAVPPENEFVRLAKMAGAKVTTEIGLVLRIATGPLLCVTGSNGKSTTTTLLGSILHQFDPRALVGGNLGGSLLPALTTHSPTAPLVLELSSFQLHYLKAEHFEPTVAVVTNLSPNHLDWHRTTLRYYEDKRTLLHHMPSTGTAVLNHGDPVLREWAADATCRVLAVDVTDPETPDACFIAGDQVRIRQGGGLDLPAADLRALRLPGPHNRLNAALAIAAAQAYLARIDEPRMTAGLADVAGLPHRLEEVASVKGRRFINDSIATTPESAICGLKSFDQPVILICGGSSKGADFTELGQQILAHAAGVVTIGSTAPLLGEVIANLGGEATSLPVHDCGTDFAAAVRKAFELCPEGGVVLLSPACASYDMFQNFQDRGEQFRTLAAELTG